MKDETTTLIQQLQQQFPGNYQLKKHGKSFYFAQLLLNKQLRSPIHALYQVCRLIDDIGDNPGLSQADAHKQLDALEQLIAKHTHRGQVTITQSHQITSTALHTLIQGVRSDRHHQQYAHCDDLITYCYQVAGTVGLMMCDLMNIKQTEARIKAIDLGVAMQLTNIARDVWTDATLGRVYLPKSLIGTVSYQTLRNAPPGHPPINQAIRKLLARAEFFYHSGKSGISAIPKPYQTCILTAACLYQAIGKAIQRNGYFTPNQRSYVSLWKKIGITGQCILHNRKAEEHLNTHISPSNNDLFRHLPFFMNAETVR